MNREQLLADFSPFADIGESAPKISENAGNFTVSFTRDGRELKLVIDSASGAVRSTLKKSTAKRHTSIATLLASDLFANMRRWAEIQRDLLAKEFEPRTRIPLNAKIDSNDSITGIEYVSNLLGSGERSVDSTEILLIDGPAGIGKTNAISQLALQRASSYKETPTQLILHIKSRGRVLSNLDDLMAFSLQTIRSHVTYDQIPVLVRYGLVVAAIDGFDELGDPNGYDTAWAQLSDFIASVRGKGALILAGRDTFISRTRLLKDVSSLRENVDIVRGLTLLPPSPLQAKEWLRKHKWLEKDFSIGSVSVLLEEGSFALRPVFLKLIAELKPKEIRANNEGFLTPFLLKNIIRREAALFGKAVQAVIPICQIESFITNFMLEAAREMADMQAEALDDATLSWIAETALEDKVSSEIVGLIKNRAAVIALLANDDRPSYKKFVHTHIQNYYLAKVAIETISNGETPKFIRRNILGAEFLSTFVDVASEYLSSSSFPISNFIRRAQNITQTYAHIDRGVRNIGALLLASSQNISAEDNAYFAGFQVDDAVIRGTAGPATINKVVINQLDCRQADLSLLVFIESSITSLIADEASRFPTSIPVPKVLIAESGLQVTDVDQITQWLDERGRAAKPTTNSIVPDKVKTHRIYALLGRACRTRQYWLREGDNDVRAKRILKDDNWLLLSRVLEQNGFLRVDTRQASGTSSPFYHIREPYRLLAESHSDTEVAKFFMELARLI